MESIVRAVAVYLMLLVIMRLSGRRTLAQITAFDFVLLLIIGEATQQALLGEDFSVTNATLVIMTLVGCDIGLSVLKRRSSTVAKVLDGCAMVVVEDGRPLRARMDAARIDVDDVLAAARKSHGIERLEQIRFAVFEASGTISIIPVRPRN